jgi:twitching motility protein PilT
LPPILRVDGELRTLSNERREPLPPLERDFLHSLAMSLLNDRRRETLERTGDVTVALPSAAGIRQRVHVSQQRGGIGLSLRLIPPEVPVLDKLGLPLEMRELLEPGAGLVLVATAPGGGRTTTLAALVDDVNRRFPVHIVTVEDPVEILLRPRRSLVVQREVGLDVPSVAAGLRAVARQDADLVMVGDVADGDAAELALAAAETGRLVLAGLTAPNAAAALARLTRLWPAAERPAARARLSAVLRGVLHQRLVKNAKGRGRTAEARLLRAAELPGAEGPAAAKDEGEPGPDPDAVEEPPAAD